LTQRGAAQPSGAALPLTQGVFAMTRRHALATFAAACHLVLVVCGASGLLFTGDPAMGDWPRQGVQLYGALSGAENGYGFFAPGVGAQIRATFILTDASGRTWTDTLERGLSHEATLRAAGSVSLAAEPDFRDDLFRSWIGTMFGRHPEARRVVVRLEMFDPPTMAEYQAGHRAEWEIIDEVTANRDELTPETN
jgi:hypothetical protein